MTLSNLISFLRTKQCGKALTLFLVLCFLNPCVVLGLPQGGQVESGDATFEYSDQLTLRVTTSDQVIINWSSFDIAVNESVNFVQPAVTSVALNRVLGGGASNIAGSLVANGGIVIVNPSGITFAPTAQVQVASLIASSMNIQSADFLAQNYAFARSGEEPVGMVVNQGKILAMEDGFLLLLGGAVANEGTLTSELGTVAMAAGDKATVTITNNKLISVAIDKITQQRVLAADGTQVKSAVSNTGSIAANGGKVKLSAETLDTVFDNAINNTGIVEAVSARENNGVIEFVSDTGTVRTSGVVKADGSVENPDAGSVLISGNKTVQAGTVSANAFDTGKAGKVEIYSEKGTWLAYGSKTEAKVEGFRGEGGTVLVNTWDGDTYLRSGAVMDVSAGAFEGDAGFIELSAKDTVHWAGRMRGVAAEGYQGATLLIDPLNIVLNTSTQTAPTNNANDTPDVNFDDAPTDGTTTIEIADVVGFSELFLQAIQDITLSDALTMDANGSVRWEAGRHININANLTVSGTGTVQLTADADFGAGYEADGTGTVTIADGATITSANQAITIKGADFTINGTGAINAGSGDVELSPSTNLSMGVGTGTGSFSVSDAEIDAITTTGFLILGSGNAQAVLVDGVTAGAKNMEFRTSSTVDDLDDTGDAIVTTGSINFASNGAIGGLNGAEGLNVDVGSFSVAAGTQGNSITVTDSGTNGGTNLDGVNTGGAGTITYTLESGQLTVISASTTGNVSITVSAGDFVDDNDINTGITGNALTLTAGVGAIGTSVNNITTNATSLTVTTGAEGVFITEATGITLTNIDTTVGNGAVSINTAAGNISVGAITAGTGSVTLNATSGTITQTGAMSGNVLTAVTFDNAGKAITLTNSGNAFTTVDLEARNAADSADAAGAISYRDTDEFDISTARTTSTFDLTAAGAVTDSGNIIIGGATTIAAGSTNNITLDTASNDFNSVGITSGNDVALVDTNGIDLAASTVSGTLTVTSGGAMTDSGALAVTGVTTLAAGSGNNITLNTGTNDFAAAVKITSGNNVTLVDANAIDLGASTVSGNLDVTSSGAMTDSGALAVTGTTALAAGTTNDITLDTSTNDFGGALSVSSADDVTLVDTDDIDLGAITAQATVTVTAGGAVTDSGDLSGSTLTVKTKADLGAAITLDRAGNAFTTVDLRARNAADNANAAGAITYRDTNGFDVAAANTTSTVTLTGGDAITDSGNMAGTTLTAKTLKDTGAAITLNSSGNAFTTVNLQARNAADSANAAGAIAYVDADGYDVSGVNTSSTLSLTSGGAITDSGAIVAGDTTSIAAGSGNDVTLNTSSNDFATVAITSGNNVTLVDTNGIILGASTVSGNLDVTASGTITDSGALAVTGTTALAAGTTNDITLDTSTNDFGGALSVSSADDVTLVDTDDIDLGAITAQATVTVTAGGAVTDSGDLSGSTLTVKTKADLGAAITLDRAGNAFTTVDLRARNAADNANAAGAITYRDTNGFDVAAANTTSTVTLTGGDAMTQSGAMAGTTLTAKTLKDAGAAITFNNASNAFTTVNLQARNAADDADASGAITYVDADDINVDTISTTGNVTLTSTAGNINDESNDGSADVTGATVTMTANASGKGIGTSNGALDTDATTIALNVGSGGADIMDLGSATLNASTLAANANLLARANGNFTIAGNQAATGTGTVSLGSDADADSSGDLTINDNVTISTANQTITLNANNIALSTTGTSIDAGSGDVNLQPTSNQTVGIGTGSGTFSITDGEIDKITTTGTLRIGINTSGAATIDEVTAGAKNVLIESSSTINDDDDTGDALVTTGTLTLTSNGAIGGLGGSEGLNIDVGTLNVTSTGGNNGTITDSGTNGGTTVIVTTGGAGAVVYTLDAGDISVDAISTTGNVTLTSTAGNINDDANDGTADVTGATLTLTASSGGIGTANGAFDTDATTLVLSVGTGSADIIDVGSVTLNASTLAENANLSVQADGGLTVAGSQTATGTGTITLSGDANADSSGDLTINDNVTISTADQALTLIGNTITLSATGTSVDSGSASVFLQQSANQAIGIGAGAGTFSITDAEIDRITTTGFLYIGNTGKTSGAIALDTVSAGSKSLVLSGGSTIDMANFSTTGNLSAYSSGAITDSGGNTAVALDARTFADAGAAITLDHASNDFDTVAIVSRNAADSANSSGAITYKDADSFGAGAITTTGNVTLTSVAGDILDSGDSTITGATLTLTSGATGKIGDLAAGDPITTDATTLVLNAGSGGVNIIDAGSVTLNASTFAANGNVLVWGNNGLTVAGNQQATGTGTIEFSGDGNNDGTGTLTINDNVTISTADQSIVLAGNTITLSTTGTSIDAGSGDVNLNESNGQSIGIGTGAGTFNITDGEIDRITTTGTLAIGTTSAGAVTVDEVTAGTKNVLINSNSTINDDDDTADALVTSGTLTLRSNGAIGGVGGAEGLNIDVGTLNVTSTGGNNITTTDSGTNGDTTLSSVLTGGAGTVKHTQDTNDIMVGTITTTGDATLISAAGDILDSGSLVTGATLTLTANASGKMIGDLAGSTPINTDATTLVLDAGSGGVNIVDAGSVTLNASTFAANGNVLVWGNNGLTVAGNQQATGTGTIEFSGDGDNDGTGTLTINDNVTISTADQSIVLAGNTITLSTTGTSIDAGSGGVNLNESNGQSIGIGTGAGTFNITDGEIDRITTTGTLAIGTTSAGAVTVDEVTAGTKNVLINSNSTINDDDDTGDAFVTSGALTLRSNGAIGASNGSEGLNIDVGTLNITQTGGNNVTITDSGTNGGTTLNSVATGGAGAIAYTQDSGDITIGSISSTGNVTLTASGGDINDDSGDSTADVTGATVALTANASGKGIGISNGSLDTSSTTLKLTAGSGGANINETSALDLGASTVSGTLTAVANGAITDSDAISVTDTATFEAGSGNNITLTTSSNDFATVAITSGNNVTLVDTNGIVLGSSTVSGNLDITASGTITDSGAIAVTGTTALAAGTTNDITLDASTNDFGGALSVSSADDVTLVDTDDIDLGAITAQATVTVTAGGAVTDSGDLSGSTLTVKTKADLGAAITLDRAGNAFTTVDLRARNAADSANAAGAITYVDTDGYDISAANTSSTLNLTAGGAITDSGAIVAGGTTTLTAGSGNNITLNTADNNFGTVVIGSGNNVTLVDTNSVDIGASTVTGDLNVTSANGAITDSAAFTVGGAASFTASAADQAITLDHSGKGITGAVQFNTSGSNGHVTFDNGTTGLIFGTSNIGGNFTAISGAAMTQTGALTVGGTSSFTTDVADMSITLDSADNALTGAVSITTTGNADATLNHGASVLILGPVSVGRGLTVSNAAEIRLGTITTGSGFAIENSSGNIIDNASNLNAGANSSMKALAGLIGTEATPINATVDSGLLTVFGSADTGEEVSVSMQGAVSPVDTLTLGTGNGGAAIVGKVMWNGLHLNPPPVPETAPVAGDSGISADVTADVNDEIANNLIIPGVEINIDNINLDMSDSVFLPSNMDIGVDGGMFSGDVGLADLGSADIGISSPTFANSGLAPAGDGMNMEYMGSAESLGSMDDFAPMSMQDMPADSIAPTNYESMIFGTASDNANSNMGPAPASTFETRDSGAAMQQPSASSQAPQQTSSGRSASSDSKPTPSQKDDGSSASSGSSSSDAAVESEEESQDESNDGNESE